MGGYVLSCLTSHLPLKFLYYPEALEGRKIESIPKHSKKWNIISLKIYPIDSEA